MFFIFPDQHILIINLDTKEVTISYYEGWIRFARKIVKPLEDNGFKAVVPVDTIYFQNGRDA